MRTITRNVLIAFALLMATALSAVAYDQMIRSPTTVLAPMTFNGASPIVLEGATDNAYETTIAVTEPTADRTITLPNSSGTVALNPYGASIEFEGATADAYETTLEVVDPTADRTIYLPDASGTVFMSGADLTFAAALTGGADISVTTAASATAGDTLDLVAGAGGTAATDGVGKNGGALTITGGAGSAKNGAGANDGNGGDIVLAGGAKGGSTGGSEVDGYVRVGSPTVGSTKATNLLAVGGAFEVDGASRFDGLMILGDAAADTITVTGSLSDLTFQTGLSGGADIACVAAAADTAGETIDVTGQAGGTAGTDAVGRAGGNVTVTAGAGSAKNGTGANDGNGGDLVLTGGAKGGSTAGTEVDGIVRIGSPTVNGTKATNMLAVAGPLEVDGAIILGTQTVTTSLQNPGRYEFSICGDETTVNNNTVYYGPNLTLTAHNDGLTCDITAAGNTTEATVDEPVFTAKAFQVLSMVCRNAADANADVSYTLRTAAGATVPSVTCTIADNGRDCVADVQTTTEIASGATMAVAVASTGDLGAVGFVCTVAIAF